MTLSKKDLLQCNLQNLLFERSVERKQRLVLLTLHYKCCWIYYKKLFLSCFNCSLFSTNEYENKISCFLTQCISKTFLSSTYNVTYLEKQNKHLLCKKSTINIFENHICKKNPPKCLIWNSDSTYSLLCFC